MTLEENNGDDLTSEEIAAVLAALERGEMTAGEACWYLIITGMNPEDAHKAVGIAIVDADAACFAAAKAKAARGESIPAAELIALSPAQAREIDRIYREEGGFVLDDSELARTREGYLAMPIPLAIIEFFNGARIALGEGGRWSGDAEFAAYANAYVPPASIYRPQPVRNLADEIAYELGGKVISAFIDDSEIPDDGRVY